MEDAFIVIPASLNGYNIVSYVASYGSVTSGDAAQYEIKRTTSAGSTSTVETINHGGNVKVVASNISPFTVQTGDTLYLTMRSNPDGSAKGYTVTLTLEL